MKVIKYMILRTHQMLLVVCLLITSANVYAQFGLAIGPKAGVSISTLRGADLNNIDSRASWLGGAFINAQITPVFTIQPEIIFTKRGAEFTSNDVRRNIKVNYFEVPVLAKFRLPIGDVVFPHIVVGPNFSFRTNVNYSSYDTNNGTVITTNDTDVKKSDVGAIVGAGLDIQTRNSGIFFTIDGRYGFGFNNINRGDDTIEIKNAGWYFSAGIGFLLRRSVHED
jgi:hypothetical protein